MYITFCSESSLKLRLGTQLQVESYGRKPIALHVTIGSEWCYYVTVKGELLFYPGSGDFSCISVPPPLVNVGNTQIYCLPLVLPLREWLERFLSMCIVRNC